MSNAVQHQTNRSPACTWTARSRRRMLYVVAVGTLISTLNQAYKSSEVHVSARMISGGRLLALTSSGIYIGALHLQRSSAMRRAGENRSLVRAILALETPACPSLVRLREYLHKIYYPAVCGERPFRKLLCKHSIRLSKYISIPRLPPDWSPLFAAFMRIPALRGNARRTNEWTNVRANRWTLFLKEKMGKKRRKSTLANVTFYRFTSLRGIPREKFLLDLFTPPSRC